AWRTAQVGVKRASKYCIVTNSDAFISSETWPTKTCLHRLDAGVGVRSDVSDALLRLVAEPGSEAVSACGMVAFGWHAAGTAVYFLGRHLGGIGNRQTARKECIAPRNRKTGPAARRRGVWARTPIPAPGISVGDSVGAVDGPAARGRAQRARAVD